MESKEKHEFGSVRISVFAVLGFIGFSTYIGAFLLFFGLVPDACATDAITAQEIRFLLGASLVLSFIVFYYTAFLLIKANGVPLFIVAAIGLLSAALFLTNMLPSVIVVAVVCTGIGLAGLSLLWFCFVYSLSRKSVFMFVSACMALGVFISLIGEHLLSLAARVQAGTLFLVALCTIAFLFWFNFKAYKPSLVANKESDKRSRIPLTAAIMLAFNYFIFGYALSFASGENLRQICLIVVLGACLIMFFDFSNKKFLSERTVAPFTIPVTTFGLLPLFVFGGFGKALAVCVLAVMFALYFTLGLSALAESARLSHLSLTRIFSKARIIDYAGFALGIVAGQYLSTLVQGEGLQAMQFSIGLVVLYLLISAICHRVRYPENKLQEDDQSKGAKNLWRRRCKAVCEQFSLSGRQQEVLMLIAQGRNARYIEEALTVSSSTAQTHIRNIYRKTGVHSRQELLNLIEKTKLYGEE